jgi:hypothetical protein
MKTADNLSGGKEIPLHSGTLKFIPCSQRPATGPYPEPHVYGLHITLCFFKIRFNVILNLLPDLPSGLYSLSFPANFYANLIFTMRATYLANTPGFNHPNIW